MRFSIMVGLAGLILTSCCSASAQEKELQKPEPKTSKAEIARLLIEARDMFIAEEAGEKMHDQARFYVWQREHINRTPLINIAIGLVHQGDAKDAEDTAKAISDQPTSAYTFTQIARTQQQLGHKPEALAALAQAAAIIKQKDFNPEFAASLWPHVLGALLKIHGDLAAAKEAAQVLGCPWDALDAEERQYQLAQFHLESGSVTKARAALQELPPNTFAVRKGQQALRADDGAGFYDWIGRSVAAPESYTADDVLLEWATADRKPEKIEAVLEHLQDSHSQKLSGYMGLIEDYRKAGQKNRASNVLSKVDSLIAGIHDQALRNQLEAVLQVQRLELDGKTPPEAIKAAGILEKYGDKPWMLAMLPDIAEAGDLDLAKQLASHKTLDDMTRGYLAVAATKAGRNQEAQEYVQAATEMLGPSKILYGVALQLEHNGDHAAAKATILDAIARAKKIKSTNKWGPDKGEVRLQEKWNVLTRCYCAAVSFGAGKEVIEQFKHDGSIRDISSAFGFRNETDTVRDWIKELGHDKNGHCDRTFALMGLSQGLAMANGSNK